MCDRTARWAKLGKVLASVLLLAGLTGPLAA
jgi:hypothetical protein